jgi:hypothetical protein
LSAVGDYAAYSSDGGPICSPVCAISMIALGNYSVMGSDRSASFSAQKPTRINEDKWRSKSASVAGGIAVNS